MNDRPTASSGPPAPEPDRHADLDALYAATRDAQPPETIDDRLRAAARRAVGSGPMRRPRRSPWLPPLALAATVLLGVGLAWQVEREQPADPVVAVAPAPQAEPAAVPPAARADMQTAPQADTPAATPAPRRQTFGRAPAPAAKPAVEASPAAQSAASESAAAAPSMRNESAPEATIASRPLAASAPAPAPADNAATETPPSAPAIAADASSGAPAAAPMAEKRAALMARKSASPRGEERAREAQAQTQTQTPEEEARLTVPEWIERIRAHRSAGREAQARAMLERFVRLHPEHTLPPDLRALRH